MDDTLREDALRAAYWQHREQAFGTWHDGRPRRSCQDGCFADITNRWVEIVTKRAQIAPAAAEPAESYGGLIAVARNAKEQGYPIHVATRTTCAEHIEQGDDKREDFAFGQPAEPADEAGEHLREYGCNVYHSEGTCEWQQRCDEPGCRREATAGWPTREGGTTSNGGYRRTCGDHYRAYLAAHPGPSE